MALREPDFAGAWYPDDKNKILRTIKEWEKDFKEPKALKGDLVGGIVPHAGWLYSGKLACNVIKVLSERSKPDTVVVFGTHMAPRMKPTILVKGDWWTPFGNLPVDTDLVKPLITKFKFEEERPEYHEQDNTIELQMPFVKHFFPNVKVVTIGAPPTDTSFEIAETLMAEAKKLKKKLVVIGSTDLTHYGSNYGMTSKGVGKEAVKWVKDVNDKKVIDLMVALKDKEVREEALDHHNSCCMGAASTALHMGKLLGAKNGEVLNYYTSYDVDPATSFVGYVGLVF
jgi:MEMO1 family protein